MAETPFLVPVTNVPQNFQLVLAGITYGLTCKWNDADEGGWVIDIADENGVPLACNIPLITGADCLEGLEYLGIQGSLFVVSTGADAWAVPTLENLGANSFLYFLTEVDSG